MERLDSAFVLQLSVNGRTVDVDAAPTTPLLWWLREDLGCLSAKYGCGLEQCGACRVLIDGVPRPSCQVLVGDLAGREIRTLETLVDEPVGRRVVDALLARNAGQCGYCLPGIAITLIHLASTGRVFNRSQLCGELDVHLCRCGSHPRIIAAALDVLGESSTDIPIGS
jgi:nicotinate dehydrogenase subunit A